MLTITNYALKLGAHTIMPWQDSQQFSCALDLLYNANINNWGSDFTKLMWENPSCAKNIAQIIVSFRQANLSPPLVAKNLTDKFASIEKISKAVVILEKAHLSPSILQYVLPTILKGSDYADEVAQMFAINKYPYPTDTPEVLSKYVLRITEEFINKKSIALFQDANIPLNDTTSKLLPKEYETLTMLENKLTCLQRAKVAYSDETAAFICKVLSVYNNYETLQLFDALHEMGINYTSHPHLYTDKLIKNHQWFIFVLNSLHKAGFTFQRHAQLHEILLAMLNHEKINHELIVGIIQGLENFSQENKLCAPTDKGYTDQLSAIDKIVQAEKMFYEAITYGPLNKSESTTTVENLLLALSDNKVFKKVSCKENITGNYLLYMPNGKEINLTLLLKNASLNQLSLSDDLIQKLGNIIEQYIAPLEVDFENDIIKLLPIVQQEAISFYTNDDYFNINLLFRGEKITSANTVDVMYIFIIGCLLNDAVNKLNHVVDQTPEKLLMTKIESALGIDMRDYLDKKASFSAIIEKCRTRNVLSIKECKTLANSFEKCQALHPKEVVLDRKENISEQVIANRNINPWTLSALTSVSRFKNGSEYINLAKNIHTKFHNPSRQYCINDSEGEVLLPQGTQVVTKKVNDSLLVSTVYSSPSFETGDHYKSDRALEYMWVNYFQSFNKDYPLLAHTRFLNLAQVKRMMLCLKYVVYYFSHFASDQKFKDYCRFIAPHELELLRAACAFSVIGGLHYKTLKENKELLAIQRNNLAAFFEYFSKNELKEENNGLIAPMLFALRKLDNYDEVTSDPNNPEHQRSNYFNKILTAVSKIDLSRVCNAKDFLNEMQYIQALSEGSAEQAQTLHSIINYNMRLTEVHGDALACTMLPNGKMIDASSYAFDKTSRDICPLKRINDLSKAIPFPIVKLPFQSTPLQDFHKRKTVESDASSKRARFKISTKREASSISAKVQDDNQGVARKKRRRPKAYQ